MSKRIPTMGATIARELYDAKCLLPMGSIGFTEEKAFPKRRYYQTISKHAGQVFKTLHLITKNNYPHDRSRRTIDQFVGNNIAETSIPQDSITTKLQMADDYMNLRRYDFWLKYQ